MFNKMKVLGGLIFLTVFVQLYLNILSKDNPVLTIIMIIGLVICAIGFYGDRKNNENNIIITNAKIYTMDKNNTIAEAAYIKDGIIVAIGMEKEILALKKGGEKRIFAKGKVFLPGLIDSHLHFVEYGNFLSSLILTKAKSIDEIIKMAKEYIGKNNLTENDWLIGNGLNDDNILDKRMPTRDDLDHISMEIPIVINRVCLHSISCNSKALEIAGIDENTFVDGGKIEKDENGKPNGILREAAKSLVQKNIPLPDADDLKMMIKKASEIAIENGLTGVQTDDFSINKDTDIWKDIIKAYQELENEDKLPIRIYEQCFFHDVNRYKNFISSGYKFGEGSEMFKIGPLKILSDGSIGSRTAYLSKPYEDDKDNLGTPILKPEKIEELVKTAHENNTPAIIHAIGDNAIKISINSIRKANEANKKDDIRHGIVHYQITDEEIFENTKKNNIMTLIQPVFIGYDSKIIEQRIGKERANTSYNWKTLFDLGIIASFGTDCPVEDLNPFENIYSAVTRQDLDGNPEGGFIPGQKITVKEAIKGYTINSAYASYDENKKGTLEPGKYADLIMISDDIFYVDPNKIKDIKCLMNIVNGEIVYKK